MLWAVYQQDLNPLSNRLLSTLFAALPVVVLFWLLVPRRWLAPKAGATAAITAILVAWLVYRMPLGMASMAFVYGAAFGILPVGWTIFNAMLLYNITVETGQFNIVRRSVAGLSADARIQAILIGFAFGAFLEGAAGGGTPVAICGAIMVGLGFDPFLAAVLCLIANTSPVAYGGLGTPLIVLNGVTDLRTESLSVMAGHQLPILSFIVPAYMVKVMCNWRQTFQVWPALLVAGGSFSLFQFTFATIHSWPGMQDVVLYPMTDIGGGIFSLVVTAIFLKFWKPKQEMVYSPVVKETGRQGDKETRRQGDGQISGHTAEAAAQVGSSERRGPSPLSEKPLSFRSVSLAWAPFAIMSVLLMLTGLIRQKEVSGTEGPGSVRFLHDSVATNYMIAVPWLHGDVLRDPSLHDPSRGEQKPETALFNFAWLTAPGTAVFLAALVSMVMLRMNAGQIYRVFAKTVFQMKIPVPTICCMLGLSYVTRYAGMDATLGVAFAGTGLLYPFFAAILGWLGVFLTGTDAGSNALFGSLQKITATQIYSDHSTVFGGLLTQGQLQVLICTANSTGGVMGKMIDAQSICVATAATHQIGKEADIFKAVVWHSIILAAIVGGITLLQAFVVPFNHLVPHP
jgi:lactate permease